MTRADFSVYLTIVAALCTYGLLRRLFGAIASSLTKWWLRRSPLWRLRVASSIASDRELARWVGADEPIVNNEALSDR